MTLQNSGEFRTRVKIQKHTFQDKRDQSTSGNGTKVNVQVRLSRGLATVPSYVRDREEEEEASNLGTTRRPPSVDANVPAQFSVNCYMEPNLDLDIVSPS